MGLTINNVKVGGLVINGQKVGGLVVNLVKVFKASPVGITISRTLDRSFGTGGSTPASGGGNVSPDTFVNDGTNWELWQVIPYLGAGVVGSDDFGDCRVQLRNRDKGVGQSTLAEMPRQVILTMDNWSGSPWTFNRPTSNAKFSTAGNNNANRRRVIDYEPARTPGANAAAEGIAQGQSFTVTLIF